LIVSSSTPTNVLYADFNASGTGWTSSSDGGPDAWQRGAPEFVELGEQPAFDYPYDSTLSLLQKCFYTGLNKSVDVSETWTLTSPSFSLSGANAAAISYAVWFNVRDGKEADDKLVVEIGDGGNPGTWTIIQTIAADEDCPTGENCTSQLTPPGAFAKVRWIRQRIRITSNLTSGRYLRFSAVRSSEPDTVMEACIDEVNVWKTY
jgi:hypothetical protein